MDEMSNKKVVSETVLLEGYNKIMKMHQHAFSILHHSIPITYLLDYTTGKYLFVSSKCEELLNFSSDKMIDGGIDFTLERYHPADLRLFNEQIFSDRRKFLKTIEPDTHKDFIFSYNYRVKNGKGSYTNLLQRNSIVQSDKNGNPLLSFGMIINIDHFKEENPVIQIIENVNAATGKVDAVLKNTYYLHEEDRMFSKREREILTYLADGLTSKEIADKLFLSEHTVIQHKKNMQYKSNTQNTTALISFAFRQHLL